MTELVTKKDSKILAAVVWEAKPGNEHCSKVLADEFVILLKGEHTCIDLHTGRKYIMKAGDALFQGKGTKVKWRSRNGAIGISAMAPRDIAEKWIPLSKE